MCDAASLCEPATLQRARGALAISFKTRDGRTVLDRLRQEGCLKARFPRPEPHGWAGAVMLNSSGGVAAGDALAVRIGLADGALACLAGQAAERFYRALPGETPAVVRNRIEIGAGGAAEWLPQETILFDGSALDRRLDVALAADGWFLCVEALVFGRTAMGERVAQASLRDVIHVERAGRPVLHDGLRIEGGAAATLGRPATAGGARAAATVLLVTPDAEARLDAVRAVLDGLEAGASAWDGMMLARILAPDGASLRTAVLGVLGALRAGRPLPRVWRC